MKKLYLSDYQCFTESLWIFRFFMPGLRVYGEHSGVSCKEKSAHRNP